jgi:alkylation response protein AidB-like acyl-CoA dehydrogenase
MRRDLPYFLHYANEEQRKRWFPGLADGTMLTAVAMTEPGTGSDLAGMRTTAVRDGDHWIVNGAKTFITGGMQADLVIVVARTATDPDNRRKGLTLLVVENGRTPNSNWPRAPQRWRPARQCWTVRPRCTSRESCRPPTRRG